MVSSKADTSILIMLCCSVVAMPARYMGFLLGYNECSVCNLYDHLFLYLKPRKMAELPEKLLYLHVISDKMQLLNTEGNVGSAQEMIMLQFIFQ